MADNDLALGRMIEALSQSPFWKSTVVFVLEDDAQNGPDHVDSHRSPMLVISPWNRGGRVHRFANTTDVLATIEEILGLDALSQFDHLRPSAARHLGDDAGSAPVHGAHAGGESLTEKNPGGTRGARESARLDLGSRTRRTRSCSTGSCGARSKGERALSWHAARVAPRDDVERCTENAERS